MESLLRAAGMRGLQEIVQAYDVQLADKLAAVGIPQQALADEDLRISLLAYSGLLEDLAQNLHLPDLGLQMAEHQNIGILGPLAIAMQNAASLRDAMHVCAQHLHTHSPGIRFNMESGAPHEGLATLRINLVLPSWLPHAQVLEQCLGDLHHFMAWLVGDGLTFAYGKLPHAALSSPQRYQSVFHCDMQFQAAEAALVIDESQLDWSLAGASEQLHRLSLDYLQLAYEPGQSSLREQVESILNRALSSTRGRRDVVAKLLELHPRTLQRRLADEGCCFQDLLDQIRKNKALYCLTATTIPLSQVPGQLGLADQTVLNRSCRRWFGQSPGQLRKGLGSGVGR